MRPTLIRTAAAIGFSLTLAALSLTPTPAEASLGGPTRDYSIGSQYGNTKRATFTENADRSGLTITVFGSSACTITGADRDITVNSLSYGWNDEITWAADSSQCDVVQFWDNDLGGSNLYVNYTDAGRNVDSSWNDEISSFYLT